MSRDWDRIWSRCGNSKLARNLKLEEETAVWLRNHYQEAQEYVRANIHSYGGIPLAAASQSACDMIMKRGRDYAWNRLKALVPEAIFLRQWLLYYKNLCLESKNPWVVRMAVKEVGNYNTRLISTLDLLQCLRHAYFATHPPSVPAPNASETDPSSPASSPESVARGGPRNSKKRVIEDDDIEPTEPDCED